VPWSATCHIFGVALLKDALRADIQL
jgi:hypothetical protein